MVKEKAFTRHRLLLCFQTKNHLIMDFYFNWRVVDLIWGRRCKLCTEGGIIAIQVLILKLHIIEIKPQIQNLLKLEAK